ncbi:hypothetical protein BDP27DRAFT_1338158 [Rhodocollybia butyracea]|uniref:Uncharacterized protein n=1 Tax=Rhodocollybia butyracea TaxID=206335 RepID=A0A9P5PAK2_9AGAR|nr:hypothetical protein BDP27DRAFT_1338158 [Rhodocollybia butyracea]
MLTDTQKRLSSAEKKLTKLKKMMHDSLVDRLERLEDKLKKLEEELRRVDIGYRYAVFANLLQSLNDVIFTPAPFDDEDSEESLEKQELINELRDRDKDYITNILSWRPSGDQNLGLKAKALSYLTPKQINLAHFLINSNVRDIYLEDCNLDHDLDRHLWPSQTFAKAVIDEVFENGLVSKFSTLSKSDFYDAIEHAPPPIQKPESNSVQPFFIEEDTDDFRDGIKAKIEKVKRRLAELAVGIAE